MPAPPLDEESKRESATVGNAPSVDRQEGSQSMMSVESNRTGSVRKQSVTNSNYQRRRLSAQKFDENESPEGGKKRDSQENFAVPDCFFVEDLPIRVDLELETPNINAKGKIMEDCGLLSHDRDDNTTYRKNSAFVEP